MMRTTDRTFNLAVKNDVTGPLNPIPFNVQTSLTDPTACNYSVRDEDSDEEYLPGDQDELDC